MYDSLKTSSPAGTRKQTSPASCPNRGTLGTGWDFMHKAILLPDGTTIYFGGWATGMISVDVNSFAKGPNILGRDFFAAMVTDDWIKPIGADGTFNKNTNAVLELEIKKQKMNIEFKNDECVKFDSDFNIIHNAFYIDNPFIVNYINSNINTDNFILEKTIHDFISDDNKNVFDSVKNKEILEKVYDVLNSIMNSKIINKDDDFYLHYNENDIEIKLGNLSAGLKSFVIIKRLLENGSLNEKDVLILDEPEIHLHPKWQLVYAELIVLLQKYFNLTITITTHSHYFLEAINRYSKKHNIDERVNFYITELSENQCNVIFKNVNDNLDIIYEKMYEPLEILSNMREEQDNERNNP